MVGMLNMGAYGMIAYNFYMYGKFEENLMPLGFLFFMQVQRITIIAFRHATTTYHDYNKTYSMFTEQMLKESMIMTAWIGLKGDNILTELRRSAVQLGLT
jgi:hypothetical protein